MREFEFVRIKSADVNLVVPVEVRTLDEDDAFFTRSVFNDLISGPLKSMLENRQTESGSFQKPLIADAADLRLVAVWKPCPQLEKARLCRQNDVIFNRKLMVAVAKAETSDAKALHKLLGVDFNEEDITNYFKKKS